MAIWPTCLQRAAEYDNGCGNSPRMMKTHDYMYDINSVTARVSTVQSFSERTYSSIAPYGQY